jgi:hypothetical protein
VLTGGSCPGASEPIWVGPNGKSLPIIMFIDSKTVNIKQSYEYSICRSLICWENRFQPGED